MNSDYTAAERISPDVLSPWLVFIGAPLCWVGSLLMAGCLVGCILWAQHLRREGRFVPGYPGPLLVALVPMAFGVVTAFWFLSSFIQASSSGLDLDRFSVRFVAEIATIGEIALVIGTCFSSLAIGALILMHRKAQSSPPPLARAAGEGK